MHERLVAEGAEVVGTGPEQAIAYIAAQVARWTKVVKSAGIKAD